MKTVVAAATAVLLACPAWAWNCAQREAVIAKLAEEYGERLVAKGLQKTRGQNRVLEIWASEETGTYTVLSTRPNGITCIDSVGTNFSVISAPPEKDGDPV